MRARGKGQTAKGKRQRAKGKASHLQKSALCSCDIYSAQTPNSLYLEGIEKGRLEGHLDGIEKEKIDFALKMWDLQEFSLQKMSNLVGLPEQRIYDIIFRHLTEQEGRSPEEAKQRILTFADSK